MSERIRALGLISKGATIDELRADSAVGAVCRVFLKTNLFSSKLSSAIRIL